MVTPYGTSADVAPFSGIDHDGVVGQDVVVVKPLVEGWPSCRHLLVG